MRESYKYAHENLTRKCITEKLDGAPNCLGDFYNIHSVLVDLTLFLGSDFCVIHMSFFFSETTCDPPTIANGFYAPNRTKYRLEDEITYRCDNSFAPASRGNKTRCTDRGWRPSPRCIRKFHSNHDLLPSSEINSLRCKNGDIINCSLFLTENVEQWI